MSVKLLNDLRFTLAPMKARALYALLHMRRAELADVSALHSPARIAGAVFGCAPDEAEGHLALLRAHGLLGDGLDLLVATGRPRARTQAVPPGSQSSGDEAEADELRARANASGRPVAELARAAGLERSSLRRYLAGEKGMGPERRAQLARALDMGPGGPAIPCENKGGPRPTQALGTGPVTPSPAPLALPAPLPSLPVSPASPSDSPSDLPDPLNPPALTAREAPGANQEPGAKSLEAAPAKPAAAPLTLRTQETPSRAERAAAKAAAALAERDAKAAAKAAARAEREAAEARARAEREAAKAARTPVDPVPAAGTLAHRVYLAITTDRVLCPITVGPGAFAELSCADGAYPGVDVLAEVRRAAEWVSGKPVGTYRDGRGFLRSWLRRAADRERLAPKAAPVGARVTGSVADLTARAMAAKAERERLAQAAKEPQAAAGGTR